MSTFDHYFGYREARERVARKLPKSFHPCFKMLAKQVNQALVSQNHVKHIFRCVGPKNVDPKFCLQNICP